MFRTLLALPIFFLAACVLAEEKSTSSGLPLLFQDDFRTGAGHWQPSDPAAWKVIDGKMGKEYSQFQQSKYKPPHRSPFNFALVKDLIVGDCVLEAQVQSTAMDVPHRDVCLLFGYQDPAHFYYVHLGKKADDHSNQVFIVKDAPRIKISTKSSAGTPWTDGWHHVKVVRKVKDGTIEIYFDDMNKPVMTANDKNFTWGKVGIGSFDDTSSWRDVKVYGVKAEKGK